MSPRREARPGPRAVSPFPSLRPGPGEEAKDSQLGQGQIGNDLKAHRPGSPALTSERVDHPRRDEEPEQRAQDHSDQVPGRRPDEQCKAQRPLPVLSLANTEE